MTRTKAQLIADRLRDFADENRKSEWFSDEDCDLMFDAAELIDLLDRKTNTNN